MNFKVIGNKSTFKEPKPWIFRPVPALRFKMILVFLITEIFCFIILAGIIAFAMIKQIADNQFVIYSVAIIIVVFILITLVAIFTINIYFNSFEYQVHGNEIIIKKGIFNKTENHVPFSNITNIAIRRGPLDQLLRIGTIIVYTAGKQTNPFRITALSGLKIYNEVMHFILGQIKTFESTFDFLIGNQSKKQDFFSNEFMEHFYTSITDIRELFEQQLN